MAAAGKPAPMNPADEVPQGTPGSGEAVCPECAGSGRQVDGQPCSGCGGSGKIAQLIGDA
jgi:hypothetical protein